MNDDLIKRSDAIGALNGWLKLNHFPEGGAGILYLVPSADRPPGRNLLEEYPSLFECSVCGASCFDTILWDCDINFCPNCGARMKGADDER